MIEKERIARTNPYIFNPSVQMCRVTTGRGINSVDDATINSNDVNRYQHVDISIFRNEFIRVDRCPSLSLSSSPSSFKSAPLPPACPFSDYSFNHLSSSPFSGKLFIAIPHSDSPRLTLVVPSLRKQFIRLFVFRLPCFSRPFPALPPYPLSP